MPLTSLILNLSQTTVPSLLRAFGTAQIKLLTPTKTKDGRGQERKNYTEGAALDCVYKIVTAERASRLTGEQLKGLAYYLITLAATTALSTGQRVKLLAHGGVTADQEMVVIWTGAPAGVVRQALCASESEGA